MIYSVFSRVFSLIILIGIAFIMSYITTSQLIKINRKLMFIIPAIAILFTLGYRLSLTEAVDWTEGITQYAIMIIGILISITSGLASIVIFIKERVR